MPTNRENTDNLFPSILHKLQSVPPVAISTAVLTPIWLVLQIVGTNLNGKFMIPPGYQHFEVARNSTPQSSGATLFLPIVTNGEFTEPLNTGSATQKVLNGGFESGTFYGWQTASGNSTWYVSSADKYEGTYAATITATQSHLGATYVQTIKTQPIAVSAGNSNALSYRHKLTKTGAGATVEYGIYWYDSAGALLSTTSLGTISADVASWTNVTSSDVAPANAVSAEYFWVISGSTAGSGTTYTFWLDNVSIIGISKPISIADFFAVRGIDASGNPSSYSNWVQPVNAPATLGDTVSGLDLIPNLSGMNATTSGALISNLRTPLPPSGITPQAPIESGWSAPMTPDAVTAWQTWVYVSASSFKVVGMDVSSLFPFGTRIRWKDGSGYKYGTVLTATFSTDTTVTFIGDAMANAAITDNYYSYYFVTPGMATPGGNAPVWEIDGRLAVATNVAAYVCTTAGHLKNVYIYCKNPGTSGSTIIDVKKNGTTVFTTTANRPTLAWNDADQIAVSGTPDDTSYLPGDLYTIDIVQVATSAGSLAVIPDLGAGGGGNSGNGAVGYHVILPATYTAISGTWGFGSGNTSTWSNFYYYNSSGALGDYIEHKIFLEAGTWDFMMLSPKNTDGGKTDVYIDGVNQGTVNLYNAALIWNQVTRITGIVVATSGLKTIRYQLSGKDGTAYLFYSNYTAWIRTA